MHFLIQFIQEAFHYYFYIQNRVTGTISALHVIILQLVWQFFKVLSRVITPNYFFRVTLLFDVIVTST